MLSALTIVCSTLFLPTGRELSTWRDFTLAEGTYYDLERGELVTRSDALSGGFLHLQGALLESSPPLRALLRPSPAGAGWSFRRDEGLPAPQVEPQAGAEFLFDTGTQWGYLRVLYETEAGLRLEIAYAQAGETRLARDPYVLSAEASRAGIELAWRPAETAVGTARYHIWRESILTAEPELLATVSGTNFLDQNPPAQLLEYRVARADGDGLAPASLGARTRTIPVERPAEWPLELEPGMTLDLLTGASGTPSAHIEIVRPGPQHVQVRPLGAVALSVPALPEMNGSWEVPAEYERVLRAFPVGGELVAHLPEGIYVLLQFTGRESERARLVRLLDPWGGKVLPRPPALPTANWQEGEVELEFAPLHLDPTQREYVLLVVERERQYGSDDWQEVVVQEGVATQVKLPEQAHGELVRYRYRYRLQNGLSSLASEPQAVVLGDPSDPATVELMLERAFAELTHADWRKRREAGDRIELLGEPALERLIAALRSSDPSLAAAARALLLEIGSAEDGVHLRAIFEARAALEGVQTSMPAGLAAPQASARVGTLLSIVRAGERPAARDWLRVVALSDPDGALRAYAELLLERLEHERTQPLGLPWALLPSSERAASARASLQECWRASAFSEDLAAELERALDLSQPRQALVVFAVAHSLAQLSAIPGAESAPSHGDARLALELVERFSRQKSPVLLAAAEELVSSPAVSIAAHAQLLRARCDQVPSASIGADLGRSKLELEMADFDVLAEFLAARRSEENTPLDLILPAGDYRPSAARAAEVLELRGSGLRIMPRAGEVRIFATLRVQDAQDVVLQGLKIEREAGLALIVMNSSLSMRDCEILGAESSINAQDAMLELDRVVLRGAAQRASSAFSIRLTGDSLLLVRDSLIESGGILNLAEQGRMYLERSLLDGQDRHAIQLQKPAEVVLRDCLLRGKSGLIFGPGRVLLEGVVCATEGTPIQANDGGVRYCADHLQWSTPAGSAFAAQALERCPLGERH